MSQPSHRRLSIVEAARLLYRTDAPSDRQIGRVYERMKSGAIRVAQRGATPRDWTTTEQALADFVAAEMVKRHGARKAAAAPRTRVTGATSSIQPRRESQRDQSQVRAVYQSIWRDAFLAVLLRRRIAHRSDVFHRCALACQVVLLASLVAAVAGTVRFALPSVSPVERAVERWIDEQTDTHQILRWHATRPSRNGAGVELEVEYRYTKDSRRPIVTRRTLRVVGDSVNEVNDDG